MTREAEGMSCITEVAVISMDEPPVNALSIALRRFVIESIDRANDDPDVKAIVLTGTARAFSAGADIKEFGRAVAIASPSLRMVIETLESSAKPVVAAISGLCLGGGLEVAMGCDARVFHPAAKLGMPEINLGLIPGEGGTQRLPRAVGVATALNMIVSGKPVSPTSLGDSLLVDALSDDPVLTASTMALDMAAGGMSRRRLRDLSVDRGSGEPFVAFTRRNLAGAGNALSAAIDAVEASMLPHFDEGLAVERNAFLRLYEGSESKARRHGFVVERAAGILATAAQARPAVGSVGVVGTGTMGRGIAIAVAQSGLPVTLVDINADALAACRKAVTETFEKARDKGKLTPEAAEAAIKRVGYAADLDALADMDLVVEAVFEKMEVKAGVFRQLDAVCRPDAILASNTSMLDINVLAAETSGPGRVLGLHFFSPANIMRLLEVVRGDQTDDAVLAAVLAFARKIGKVPVISGVCEGFIGNRMINAYVEEAMFMLEEGVSPYRIDAALESWGMAMGPFRMMDLAGNDIAYAIRQRRYETKPDESVSRIADPLCEAGRLGQKTGSGWYLYSAGSRKPEHDPAVVTMLAAYNEAHGLAARSIDDDEIVDRCILALVNEGARILEEGIATSSGDIDAVYLTGYGFPAARGGPMFYAEDRGLYEVARRMRGFARHDRGQPDFWRPAALIERAATRAESLDSTNNKEKNHG